MHFPLLSKRQQSPTTAKAAVFYGWRYHLTSMHWLCIDGRQTQGLAWRLVS